MITVEGLVAIQHLGLRFLAGAEGGHRLVTWAHAVDLPDPWRWVAAGNLIMTVGTGLPADGQAQSRWLHHLADSNASALLVAPKDDVTVLHPDLLKAADARMFPVLHASFDLEFAKLARLVSENVLQAQRARFDAGQRLFQTYAAALRDAPDMQGRLDMLGQRLGVALQIEDAESGAVLLGGRQGAAGQAAQDPIAIPGRSRAALRIWRGSDGLDDPFLRGALIGLLSVELERMAIERDAARRDGEVLIRELMAAEISAARSRLLLKRRGLSGPLAVLAIRPGRMTDWAPADLHHAPEFVSLQPLFLDDGGLIVVLPLRRGLAQSVAARLGPDTRCGLSAAVAAPSDLAEGVRQARLALTQAVQDDVAIWTYDATDGSLLLGARSVAEAKAVVARYLGPLIEHDHAQGGALVRTLAAFLAWDGAGKATAADLGIHRQTLVYRLKLIEELTGIKPASSAGIARFHGAYEAGRAAGLLRL